MIVRRAVYAGRHYFGDPGRLRAAIEVWTEDAAELRAPGDLIGLITPHLGDASDPAAMSFLPVAGAAYKMLYTTPLRFDVVTMIAPQQQPGAHPWLCEAADAYETPLALVRVDHPLRERIGVPTDADAGDAIEMQLPFAQLTLGDVPVLPLRAGVEANASPLMPHADALGLTVTIANLPAGAEKTAVALIEQLRINRADAGRRSGVLGRLHRGALGGWTADLAALSAGLEIMRAQGANTARLLRRDGVHSAWAVYRAI